ncbi:MAG: YfhO family protein [Butyrivibrio sp.]|nr:YfhO family protein [Butyrivibrio sp.]
MLGDKINRNKFNLCHACISSLFILIMYLAVLVICRITPFGDKTFLMYDLKRQYVDYYAYLRTIYSDENSAFYSFNAALGSGTLGFFAYYLTSPFLFILNLFDRSNIPLGITIVIGFKLMLAGFAMNLFLQRYIPESNPEYTRSDDKPADKGAEGWNISSILPLGNRKSLAACFGAVSWALSGFLFAHSMNMMWMDVVMLLPLYIWSLDILLKTGQKHSYISMLLLMLLLNYYITYQVLLFTAFWTISDLAVRKEKHPVGRILTLAYSALISVLISAVIMVPTFFELMNSPKDVTLLGLKLTGSNLSLLDIFSKLPTLSYDYIEARFGYPQIFCGVLMLFMIVFFFASKEIPLRVKLGYLALFAVFAISFERDLLNVIWHAGMEPSGHPYRQAFMCVFLMIICGCRAFALMEKELSIPKVAAAAVVFLIVLFLIKRGMYDHFSDYTWFANLLLIALYAILLTALVVWQKKGRAALVLGAMLILVNMADLTANAAYTYQWQSLKCESESEYRDVVSGTWDAVCRVKQDEDESVLYRMENLNPRQQNDAFQYDYNGITQYSSAGLIYVRYFLQRLGLNDDGLYTHYGHDSTETLDSLLGIKYVLTDGTFPAHRDYSLVEDGREKVYRNPYALSPGILTDKFDLEGISDIEENLPLVTMEHVPSKDAFALQEDIYGRLLGREVTFFTPADADQSEMYMSDDKPRYDYKVKTAIDGELYLYLDGLINAGESLSVFVEDEFLTTYGNAACVRILNLGYHVAGEEVNVSVQGESTDDNFGRAIFVTEDTKALKKAYDELWQKCVPVKVSPSVCEMEITVPEGSDGVFLTIPYEDSWKVTAGGHKLSPLAVYDSLTYIPLEDLASEGELRIRMKYVTKGILPGLLLSIIGIALYIFVAISERAGRHL